MKKANSLLVLLTAVMLQASAQDTKLPNIQAGTGIKAPAVKVDGKLAEWNGAFQAYNKQTQLYYTVSNDAELLYLTVRSTSMQNNNKIAAGGISFVINTDGKKKIKDGFSFTYPVIARQQRPNGAGAGAGPGGGGFGPGGGDGRGPGGGFGGGRNTPDSATLAARHKQVVDAAKEIKVLGFKDIADSLLSVYNEYGIKAAISYDAAGNYNYELAIPLKLINLKPGDTKEIAYDIKVNGITMPANFGQRDGGGGNPAGGGQGGSFGGGGQGGGGDRGGNPGGGGGQGGGFGGGPGGGGMADMFAATDFWGKYILAQ